MKDLLAAIAMAAFSAVAGPADATDTVATSVSRVALSFDRAEADAALAILEKRESGQAITEADWQRLFSTDGYRRLGDRERSLQRPFEETAFRDFMLDVRALPPSAKLRRTLDEWSNGSTNGAASAALRYLPDDARLHATVYPMIKPRPNEFVFDLRGNPAIFLYLDPSVSADKAANTMAHELHHIGLASVCPRDGAEPGAGAEPGKRELRQWLPSFGEGLAMLAAAGGKDVHPHATSNEQERAAWDASVSQFAAHVAEMNAFFLQVAESQAGDEQAVETRMRSYFGVQGPWYTVGWKMAVLIEQYLGRERMIAAFCDPGLILSAYNEAAALHLSATGESLPLWNQRLAQ